MAKGNKAEKRIGTHRGGDVKTEIGMMKPGARGGYKGQGRDSSLEPSEQVRPC